MRQLDREAAVDAVVVGASAGGVDALMTLLPALPATFGPALLVVLHLPRKAPSALVAILSPRCEVPILEAEDKAPVRGGHVYIAPPDYHLLVDRGPAGPTIALSTDDLVNYSRPSIDVLFDSAADCYDDRVAGIILTGANADGAEGLAAIARAGGLTIVQQPADASATAMPTAALERVEPDFVLPLAAIVDLLRTSAAFGDRTSS